MKNISPIILAILLCLLTACGENPPSLQFQLGEEVISIPGQADEITHVSFFGEVSTRQACYDAALEPVEVDAGEDGASVALSFSCRPAELTVSKLSPEQEWSDVSCQGTLTLEPGCRYSVTGTFEDGRYTYKMTFAQIIVADNAHTAAIKEEIAAKSYWE